MHRKPPSAGMEDLEAWGEGLNTGAKEFEGWKGGEGVPGSRDGEGVSVPVALLAATEAPALGVVEGVGVPVGVPVGVGVAVGVGVSVPVAETPPAGAGV